MQKEVKDFFKELRTNSDLEEKFRSVKNQEEFGRVISPYVKGCDPKKFVEEVVEVWEVVNGKKSNKISQKDLSAISGGKIDFKRGMNSFFTHFDKAMGIGGKIVKEGQNISNFLKNFTK
ncbi:MAG: Nif11-like leader peptide family natural product precursor [Oscillospiraceae bacterium]|jgi:hypothetical protein|nr:Nif11-like leader peptide family natural product precursor [Oscillospiraceae bacterium]